MAIQPLHDPALEALRALIAEKRITQPQVAAATGVHQSQISRILRGEARRSSPNVQRLRRYAESLVVELPSQESWTHPALRSAIAQVWDGSDHHARAIARVIVCLGEFEAPTPPPSAGAPPDG
jgi:transcriptional regulator with XRE-family HTH domain